MAFDCGRAHISPFNAPDFFHASLVKCRCVSDQCNYSDDDDDSGDDGDGDDGDDGTPKPKDS